MTLNHCNKSECLTSKRMGQCECNCLDCNMPMEERTTLDTLAEKRAMPPEVAETISNVLGSLSPKSDDQMWQPPALARHMPLEKLMAVERRDETDGVLLHRGVQGCARCGEDHEGPIHAPRLERPFTPAEALGASWTHWFPCPKNGQPVLVRVML